MAACEESQRVCTAFRNRGHEAYSCDIEPYSGGHPEWHIQDDVLNLINGNCIFQTSDGKVHTIIGKWDMIIAFPPCTYLTSAGVRHYSLKCNSAQKVTERIKKREIAAKFFMTLAFADCERIAIENPVGYMNTQWRKPDQIIHPYYFGDNAKKRTCLWLKKLPKLKPTNMLPEPGPVYICQGSKCNGKKMGWCEGIRGVKGGQKERSKARSKTFPGIAEAMADQWGKCD